MPVLDRTDLERVVGATGPPAAAAAAASPALPTTATPGQNNDFGRCGPGSGWSFLGNIYTPACVAHDTSVRTAEAKGASPLQAHFGALPLLPAAVGSYFHALAFGQ